MGVTPGFLESGTMYLPSLSLECDNLKFFDRRPFLLDEDGSIQVVIL